MQGSWHHQTYVFAIPRTDSQVMQAGGYSNELYLSYLLTLCRFSCSFVFPISTKCFRYWCAKKDTWKFNHSQYIISTQHSLFQCHEQVTLITSSILYRLKTIWWLTSLLTIKLPPNATGACSACVLLTACNSEREREVPVHNIYSLHIWATQRMYLSFLNVAMAAAFSTQGEGSRNQDVKWLYSVLTLNH